MRLSQLLKWVTFRPTRRGGIVNGNRSQLKLTTLERREVPAGYLAAGAGPGDLPQVAIRVDIQDQLGGSAPSDLGSAPVPRSDGKPETTSQVFMPFDSRFRGGVNVATGNFDGFYRTPDHLVTAAGPGGGPHVIIWKMKQNSDGKIVTNGVQDQFFAFDVRFRGGVNVTTGDLDGDGRAELICAAGAGGGPHVKIYSVVPSTGRFKLANEFFAYDTRFTGGVTVASGQGYKTNIEVRQPLDARLPEDAPFSITPYGKTGPVPGADIGVPLISDPIQLFPLNGDVKVPPGGTDPDSGQFVPLGTPGHLDADDVPLPYVTVGAGVIQYLSGNLLNSLGNIAFRPDRFVPPDVTNTGNSGKLVLANWPMDAENFPGAPFEEEVNYGPFVQLGVTAEGTPVITRLTPGAGTVQFRNQLVTGAGPGGGPHVRIWDFTGAAGKLTNNGVGKEFMAFNPTFTGGINVSINDVVANPTPNGLTVIPGRTDFTVPAPYPFIIDTTKNSATPLPLSWPIDTNLFRKNSSEIVVGQMSGGSLVRIFSDNVGRAPDTTNKFSNPAPIRRTTLAELNMTVTEIDFDDVVSPGAPLDGFVGATTVTNFDRAIDPQFTGGVSTTVSAFNFLGSAEVHNVGGTFDYFPIPITNPGTPVNPVLGQATFGAGPSTGANRGTRVRIFDQMSPNPPEGSGNTIGTDYGPSSDFLAITGSRGAGGVHVAFGFGTLAEPGLDIISLPPITVTMVSDAILFEA